MSGHTRYTTVAMVLHWTIAVAILGNLVLGFWMGGALATPGRQSTATAAFQLHKSIGLTILALSLLRLAWRFLYPPHPLPAHMAPWERGVAHLTHWLFYGLMVGLPLSGWLYVSTQWRGDAPFNIPTLWFGLFEVPHLFGLNAQSDSLRQDFASVTGEAHELLALGLIVLLLLHIGAALRHQFWQHDGLLARMLPGLASPERLQRPPRRPAGGTRGTVAAVLTLAVAALAIGSATGIVDRPTSSTGQSASPLAETLSSRLTDADTAAPAWPVDDSRSQIRFSVVHAGVDFQGHFETWLAAIHFNPQQPERSAVVALIDTGSGTDGVPLHDSTLPQGEWFDVANYPHASYRSTRITARGDDTYQMEGTLTIKDRTVETQPLLITVAGDTLTIQGTVELDRADVNMGMSSDPSGQYVSRTIAVDIETVAQRPDV